MLPTSTTNRPAGFRAYAGTWKSSQFLTSGYSADIPKIVNQALYRQYDEMVIVKDIQFFSLCELSPFALLRQDSRRLSAD
jgi:hypothetical protein